MFVNRSVSARVFRVVVMLVVFLLAGLVASEWLLADEKPKAVTVATWNVEWLFDAYQGDNRSDIAKQQSAPDLNEWEWKKSAVANVIASMKPTILCLQEVENRDVVYQLRKKLQEEHDLYYRYAFISGYDFGTEQDVAILYQSGLVEYSRREQSREMFDSGDYYSLSKHLIARFEWGTGDDRESLVILNAHLRARAEKRDLRQRQCRLIHEWLKDQIAAGENVIATGDFNTEDDYGNEVDGSEILIVRGKSTESALDDLLDVNKFLPEDQRSTHISGRQYDRIFYSQSLAIDDPQRKDLVLNRVIVRSDLVIQKGVDENHWDGYYSIPQDERDISDHYPLVAEFVFE